MADTVPSNPYEGIVNMTDTISSNRYEPIFTAQKAFFRTGATRTRNWRLDQLARMERMVSENEAELQNRIRTNAAVKVMRRARPATGSSALAAWRRPETASSHWR
jgi:aldehyde dehydrogenase (NAD+)